MYRTYAFRSIIITSVCIVLFIVLFFVSQIEILKYGLILWLTGLVWFLVFSLNLCDININNSITTIISTLNTKSFNIHELHILNISIPNKGPYFLVDTNKGIYKFNFTKDNYKHLITLLNTQIETSNISENQLQKLVKNTFFSLK